MPPVPHIPTWEYNQLRKQNTEEFDFDRMSAEGKLPSAFELITKLPEVERDCVNCIHMVLEPHWKERKALGVVATDKYYYAKCAISKNNYFCSTERDALSWDKPACGKRARNFVQIEQDPVVVRELYPWSE